MKKTVLSTYKISRVIDFLIILHLPASEPFCSFPCPVTRGSPPGCFLGVGQWKIQQKMGKGREENKNICSLSLPWFEVSGNSHVLPHLQLCPGGSSKLPFSLISGNAFSLPYPFSQGNGFALLLISGSLIIPHCSFNPAHLFCKQQSIH